MKNGKRSCVFIARSGELSSNRDVIVRCFSIDSPDYPVKNSEFGKTKVRHFSPGVTNFLAVNKPFRNYLLTREDPAVTKSEHSAPEGGRSMAEKTNSCGSSGVLRSDQLRTVSHSPDSLRTNPESERPALLHYRYKVTFLAGRRNDLSNDPRMLKGQRLNGEGWKLHPDADAIQVRFAIGWPDPPAGDAVAAPLLSKRARRSWRGRSSCTRCRNQQGEPAATGLRPVAATVVPGHRRRPHVLQHRLLRLPGEIHGGGEDAVAQDHYDRLWPVSYSGTDVILMCCSIDWPDFVKNKQESGRPEVHHFCTSVPIILAGKNLRNNLLTLLHPAMTLLERAAPEEGRPKAKDSAPK
ncbi:hypothetical protein MTO96_013123 [Rhipicephalus appendiculatus]